MSKARANGKTAITILLNEQDVNALHLIMEATYRETMTDCVRAIIRETAKNFLPAASVITDNNATRTKRGAAGMRAQ